jgi:hypothetical protein
MKITVSIPKPDAFFLLKYAIRNKASIIFLF